MLQLPAGSGAGLAAAMKRLVDELRAALPAAFERDEYRARREAIEQQFKQRSEVAFGALQSRAESKNITLLRTPMGLALAPTRDGKVLAPELFNQLPPAERESIQHEIEAIQTDLEAIMRQVPLWEREHRDAVQALNRETTGFAIAHLMAETRGGYSDLPEVAAYLDAVERDIKENVDDFLAPAAPPAPDAGPPVPAPIAARYRGHTVSPLSGQRHRRQQPAARRAGHLRGQPDAPEPGRPGRASGAVRRPGHRFQPAWSPARCTAPMAAISCSTRRSC